MVGVVPDGAAKRWAMVYIERLIGPAVGIFEVNFGRIIFTTNVFILGYELKLPHLFSWPYEFIITLKIP